MEPTPLSLTNLGADGCEREFQQAVAAPTDAVLDLRSRISPREMATPLGDPAV